MDLLKVQVAKTSKASIEQPPACQNNILPKIHCSYLVIGRSGSGKSNVVIHMLKSKGLLGGVFKHIYYFTGSPDDSFVDNVKIKKQNIIREFDESKIQSILSKNEEIIKRKGFAEAAKTHGHTAIIFDDILSHPKFLRSKMLLKLVTECRHYLTTCIFNTQSYKTNIPRAVRINCRGLIFFPSSRGEMDKFADEQCPPRMSRNQFLRILDHCTSQQYQFCFINHDAPPGETIRKNFDTIVSAN